MLLFISLPIWAELRVFFFRERTIMELETESADRDDSFSSSDSMERDRARLRGRARSASHKSPNQKICSPRPGSGQSTSLDRSSSRKPGSMQIQNLDKAIMGSSERLARITQSLENRLRSSTPNFSIGEGYEQKSQNKRGRDTLGSLSSSSVVGGQRSSVISVIKNSEALILVLKISRIRKTILRARSRGLSKQP